MAKDPSPGYSFDWLKQKQPQIYARVMESVDQPLDISLRINTLKSTPDIAIKKWSKIYDWQYDPVPFSSSGYWIRDYGKTPSRTLEHRLGYFYIQEAASMLPAELFDFSEIQQPLILDMAASPGGKTIHLADRSSDQGFILANDASRSRIQALRIVLENWGVINQAITCLPGELFGSLFPETFDAVLLDAPCSMQALRAAESHKTRAITQNEVEVLAERQTHLLESALRAARIGGQVVYSTCTLTPQEDEGVLAALLEEFSGFFEIVSVDKKLPNPAPGLAGFNGDAFPEAVQNAVRLWPHIFGTAGFFAAKLVKTGSLPEITSNRTFRPKKLPKLTDPAEVDVRKIKEAIADQFGFDLEALMQKQRLQVVEIDGQLSLIARDVLDAFSDMPWLSGGMALGKNLPAGWQPSHAFVSRFGDRFSRGVLTLENEYLLAWERGEDLRGYHVESALISKVIALRDERGRNLGRAKVLQDRLKNLLPTRLF